MAIIEDDELGPDPRTRGLPPNGLTLIVGPDSGIIENADVRVRWCVTPELTAYLESKMLNNPHILLTTYNEDGRNEWRGLFPLNEVMSFARFYQAGKMLISALIIDMPDDALMKRQVKDDWLKRDYDSYNRGIQHYGRMKRSSTESNIFAVTEDSVIIPSGVFGKEYPEWVNWYVNMWHGKNKTDDDCEYRRRGLLGLVKWIPMLAWALLLWTGGLLWMGIMYGLGLGSWVVNPKAILNPFSANYLTMTDKDEGQYQNLRDSRFAFHIRWKENIVQPVFSLLWVSPTMVLFLFGMSMLTLSDQEWIFQLYNSHYFTAIFVMIFGGVHALYDIFIAIVNAARIKFDNQHYISTDEMYKWGAGVFAAVFVVVFLIAALPLWLLLTIVFVVAAITVVGVMKDAGIGGELVKGYFRFVDGLGMWLDTYFGPKQTYDNMRELLCPDDKMNLSTDLKNLPQGNVSWLLRYRDLKSMVCKPRQRQ